MVTLFCNSSYAFWLRLSRLGPVLSSRLFISLLRVSLIVATVAVGFNPPLLQAVEPRAPQLLFTLSHTAPSAVLPPSYSSDKQAVNLTVATLDSLVVGGRIVFDLQAQGRIALEIERSSMLINGDRVIEASTSLDDTDVQLILTFSGTSLFGRLKAGADTFQLQAALGALDYEGWFYRPTALQGQQLQNDSILISRLTAMVPTRLPPLSLSGLSSDISARENASLRGSDEGSAPSQMSAESSTAVGDLTISHAFSRRAVYRGGNVTATVEVINSSFDAANGHYFDVYFLPESAELNWGSADCAITLSSSAQRVLRCNLDTLPARSTKKINLDVSTSELTPSVLQSTVLLDETLRADTMIRVVADVRLDSDLDGISDFNESLLETDSTDPASLDPSPTVIDVIALHSKGARDLYSFGVETRINQLISVANQIFINSGVDVLLRVVYHGQADAADTSDMATTLDDLLARRGDAFNTVEALRSNFGGDIILHFRPLEHAASRCGLAPVGGYGSAGDFSDPSERFYAAAVVAIDCPLDIVVAHEVGHLMGLTHSLREDGEGGTFDFATGHGIDDQFTTIMALPAAFGDAVQAGVFSSPLLPCGDSRCGIAEDEAGAADAVSALNLVRHQIGRYSDSLLARLPPLAVRTLSGKATKASIAIGASRDGLLSISDTVSADDLVSLQAEVLVDPEHIASQGSVHVLLALEGKDAIYQLNSQGEVQRWDGTLDGLVPFGGSAPLNAVEQLTIINRLRMGKAFAGERLAIFVAYQVKTIDRGSGLEETEIVYPQAPYWLSIEHE